MAERMGKILCWETEALERPLLGASSPGFDRVPSGGSRPLTPDRSSPDNTGNPERSFQAVFLLAPMGACRPGQADRSVPSPLPHPTPVFILEQSRPKAWVPPGAFPVAAQCALLSGRC